MTYMVPFVDTDEEHVVERPVLYRYEGSTSCAADEYGDVIPGSGHFMIHCWDFPIIRRTPKGVWIRADGRDRFVLQTANKQWAWPTRKQALESFIQRKRRQITIMQARFKDAEGLLLLARTVQQKESEELPHFARLPKWIADSASLLDKDVRDDVETS